MTDRDLSDGDGHLLGVGSAINGHAQFLVDLGDWDGEDLPPQIGVATKRYPGLLGWREGRRRRLVELARWEVR